MRLPNLLTGGVLAACLLGGCGGESRVSEDGKFVIRLQLDWIPEPQHGGFFQAMAKGYFAEEGLEVQWKPGGPVRSVTEVVASGGADFGQSASTHIMQSIANGMPITNVASLFHHLPTALLMRPENPVQTWEDLDGKTIIARPEAVYLKYLRHRYGIEFDVVKRTGGVGAFLADPQAIEEGFFIAEPYFIRKQGVEVRWLSLAQSGYDPYTIVFANKDFLAEHPEQARAFLRAWQRGWKDYLEGDPAPGNAIIRQHNPEADPGFIAFGRQQIIDFGLARGDPELGEDYGTIDPERIRAEIRTLESLGVLEPGELSLDDVLALDFVPAPLEEAAEGLSAAR
ncbi:MAG: ABC transporter substrate-binding protein [Opitutales bacterium]